MWLAVDKDESVWLYDSKPERLDAMDFEEYSDSWAIMPFENCIQTSKEVMLKLIGKELIWNDEPIEIL